MAPEALYWYLSNAEPDTGRERDRSCDYGKALRSTKKLGNCSQMAREAQSGVREGDFEELSSSTDVIVVT
jgi:hypothetical protein